MSEISSITRLALPQGDPLTAAAREIVNAHRQALPDLSDITVVLPALHAAPVLSRALAAESGLRTLLLPRITTLANWAAEAALPDLHVLSDARREAAIYCALRDRRWFGEMDRWSIAGEVRRLMDELTAYRIGLPASLDDFVGRLEEAYQARAGESLQFEARLVHELWFALARQADGLDRVSAYHLQLAELARLPGGPLYGIVLEGLTPAEADFFSACSRHRPVCLMTRGEAGESVVDSLLQAALVEAGDAVRDSVGTDLLSRARAFRDGGGGSPLAGRLRLFPGRSLEHEARAVDTQVRQWLLAGKQRIAVVVQDRLAARRVRALLERAQVLVQDETGWTFSTAAASAAVMRWLDTVSGGFYFHELLDLLKSPFVFSDQPWAARKEAVFRLEELVRRHGVVSGYENYLSVARRDAEGVPVVAFLERLGQARRCLEGSPRTLAQWMAALKESLAQLGIWAGLKADMAGDQLLQLLEGLSLDVTEEESRFAFGEWRRWLDRQLEGATFRDERIRSPVVFVPLGLTRLRCFDAAVILGADESHLPSQGRQSVFFNQGVRGQLGLPTSAAAEALEHRDLLALLSGCPDVLATWQAVREGEPNLLSPLLERLNVFHEQVYGRGLLDEDLDTMIESAKVSAHCVENPELLPCPGYRPQPVVPPTLVPLRISAGGYNSLMACPYQYFGRHVLGLNELDEVRLELEKRDFGDLVHRILHRFHQLHPVLLEADSVDLEKSLGRISDTVFADAVEANYLSRAWALRWAAAAPAYIAWQLERERQGWRWAEGEIRRELELVTDRGHSFTLHGRLDRVDRRVDGPGWAVLDYKTQGKDRLQAKLEVPGEDVQLAVYGALFGAGLTEAAFVGIDKDEVYGVSLQEDVTELGEAVVTRLRRIFDDMLSGMPLPAQGLEEVCVYCEMRGLCRKDYWAE